MATTMEEIVAAILGIKRDLDERHDQNITQARITDTKVDAAIRGIDELRAAFPDGDLGKHARYHEAIIQRAEAKARLYEACVTEITTKGLWALLVFLGAAVIYYIKGKL
jgi:hypothetical protein